MQLTSRKFLGFDHLFLIAPSYSRQLYIGEFVDAPPASELPLLRGSMTLDQSISVNWSMGAKTPGDVIATTSAIPIILSRRAVSVLEKEGFTGWSTYPVLVSNKEKTEELHYAGLTVTGRCGEIDNNRSEVVGVEYPAGIFPMYRGLYFDETQWSGDDFFCTSNETGYVFVTERVRDAFLNHKVSPLKFTPLNLVDRSQLS
jgi:hypothetical protein